MQNFSRRDLRLISCLVTYKRGIYDLPHELTSDINFLSFVFINFYEISKKCQDFIEWQCNAQSYC